MLSTSLNLFGTDTIMLFMIAALLVVPVAVVIVIAVLVGKNRKVSPPPLPRDEQR